MNRFAGMQGMPTITLESIGFFSILLYFGFTLAFSSIGNYCRFRYLPKARKGEHSLFWGGALALAVIVIGFLYLLPSGNNLYISLCLSIAIGVMPFLFGLRNKKLLSVQTFNYTMIIASLIGLIVGLVFIFNVEAITIGTTNLLDQVTTAYKILSYAITIGFLTITIFYVLKTFANEKAARFAVLTFGMITCVLVAISAFMASGYYIKSIDGAVKLSEIYVNHDTLGAAYSRLVNSLIIHVSIYATTLIVVGIFTFMFALKKFFNVKEDLVKPQGQNTGEIKS